LKEKIRRPLPAAGVTLIRSRVSILGQINECQPTPLAQLGLRASLLPATGYRGVAARWWCRTFLGTCTCVVVRGSQANIELWALPAAVLDLASLGQYRLSEIVAPA